jgi:endonuclease YncB( thermonuclease family)
VRLAGIDTLEKGQPLGQVAKNHLSSLVNGQTVKVNYYKRDRYGRIVGKVLANGADAGPPAGRGRIRVALQTV